MSGGSAHCGVAGSSRPTVKPFFCWSSNGEFVPAFFTTYSFVGACVGKFRATVLQCLGGYEEHLFPERTVLLAPNSG